VKTTIYKYMDNMYVGFYKRKIEVTGETSQEVYDKLKLLDYTDSIFQDFHGIL